MASSRTMVALVVVLLSLTLLSGTSSATGWYLGATVGRMIYESGSDQDDAPDRDDLTNFGIVLADRINSYMALEAGLTVSATRADTGSGDKWGVSTAAAYVVYRSTGKYFLKAKVGALSETVTIGDASRSQSGLSVGLGGGLQAGPGSVEIEGTVVTEDMFFASLTYIFFFGDE